MANKKMTLGVIVGNRGFFPGHLAESGRKEILEAFEKAGIEAVTLEPCQSRYGAVETYEEAKRCAELFRANSDRIDGVIVTLPNFGDERGVANTLRMSGLEVPVLDSADFLADPEAHLRWLCGWLGIGFTPAMLRWPAGPRDSDGVWAPHWYAAVWASTGFQPRRPREVVLGAHDAAVAEACRSPYETLRERRLRL